jgi:hypothetical protein
MGIFLASFQSNTANAFTITFAEGLSLAKDIPLYHDYSRGRVGDFYLDEYGISFSSGAVFIETGDYYHNFHEPVSIRSETTRTGDIFSVSTITVAFNFPASAVTIWAMQTWSDVWNTATLSALDANGVVIATDHYQKSTSPTGWGPYGPGDTTYAVPLSVVADNIRGIQLTGGWGGGRSNRKEVQPASEAKQGF